MTAPDPTPTADPTDALVLAAFRRLANALREAALESRGPIVARDSALYEAGQAVDEIADLICDEVGEPVRPATTATSSVGVTDGDPYDLLPEG